MASDTPFLAPDAAAGSPFRRHPANPVLTAAQAPYRATLVFNAGVVRFGGRYIMMFRNDYGDAAAKRLDGTSLGLAVSDDGVHWQVEPRPVRIIEPDGEIRRAYDPRLTVLDGRCYVCFAVDTRHGIRGGIAVTDDFERFELLSLSVPDNRNMVIFPERIGGRIARLERPFPVYGRGAPEAFDIWYSDSPDGRYWGNSHLVLGSEQVRFANSKIGPAAPPVRTERGWLTTFHAVWKDPERVFDAWEDGWIKEYRAGILLLDLDEPWRVVAMGPGPILAPSPEYPYEWRGFRGGAIFPGGLILEPDGELKLYYGAADTVEALATARLEDVLAWCRPVD